MSINHLEDPQNTLVKYRSEKRLTGSRLSFTKTVDPERTPEGYSVIEYEINRGHVTVSRKYTFMPHVLIDDLDRDARIFKSMFDNLMSYREIDDLITELPERKGDTWGT